MMRLIVFFLYVLNFVVWALILSMIIEGIKS